MNQLGYKLVYALAVLVLAACASLPPSRDPAASATSGSASVQPPVDIDRFDAAIAAFETADAAAMPPRCAHLFVGSSSIRFWASLDRDFPDRTVINRGFGGSTIAEVNHYFDRIVAPYRPQAIIFYAGENDLNAGISPAAAFADFQTFMKLKDKALKTTPVWYISAKPSKLRTEQAKLQDDLNGRIRALADRRKDLAFIDVAPAMKNTDGSLKDIFVEDNLHMTPAGYAIWTPIVDAALDAGQPGAAAPGC